MDSEQRDGTIRSLRLALLAWSVVVVAEVVFLARPTAFGTAVLHRWPGAIVWSSVYDLGAVLLLCLPLFLLVWLTRRQRLWLLVQLGVLTAWIFCEHADNELLRLMGVHVTGDLIDTYLNADAWVGDTTDALVHDQGMPFLGIVLGAVLPIAFVFAAIVIERRPPRSIGLPPAGLIGGAVAVAALCVGFHVTAGWGGYRAKPWLFVSAGEWTRAALSLTDEELSRSSGDYQRSWRDRGWRFPNADYPFVREAAGVTPATDDDDDDTPWNVIYLQLETLRGWDTGHLNPSRGPSATPFLDELAASPTGATWTRASSYGRPTADGFLAAHCSVRPHSHFIAVTRFAHTRLLCLPELLRDRGWRTEFFTASDPAWDNQSTWLARWYDEVHFRADRRDRDRALFRQVRERILELARADKPFFVGVTSIVNHYPFLLPDGVAPADYRPSDSTRERILSTTRHTDDAVRGLLTSLAGEPFMKRTLIVITGDHGFNLGERGVLPPKEIGHREELWVPLLFVGAHPGLESGEHNAPASLLDIAPTVAALLGVRATTPWQGHSLVDDGVMDFLASTDAWTVAETPALSVVAGRDGATATAFAADDRLQQTALGGDPAAQAQVLIERAQQVQHLNDWALENNRVWPAQR